MIFDTGVYVIVKKNILVVGPSSSGLKGGQATHMENINTAFENAQDVFIYFFYSSSGLEGTENPFSKVIRLFKTIFTFPFHAFNKDIVHINSSFDNKALIRDLFLTMWARLLNKQLVIQYHGGNPYNINFLNKGVIHLIYKAYWRNSKVLILNNTQEKWFYDLTDIKTIKLKNYVAVPDVPGHTEAVVFKFTYIGRIIKEKGLLEIVHAAEILSNSYDFVVEIFGAGEDFELVDDYIKSKNLSHIVNMKGPIESEQKNCVLAASQFFLYPSYYPEGLPYAVLEALSYGLPIICTNAGALEYVVEHGLTCLKVNEKSSAQLADAMQCLMDSFETRALLSENSREIIIKHYSLEAMKKTFLRVWNEH